jgi:acetolactate synthase-1/2/3 large subunit
VSRTTVADVVIDGLVRAGTPRIFGVPGAGTHLRLLEAARARDLPLVLAYGDAAACVMAAVTGDLTGAPGAALAGPGPGVAAAGAGVAHAALDRSPMILLTDRHPGTLLACKASLRVEAGSAAHWIAHAVQLAMKPPCGPVHVDVPPGVAGEAAVPLATSCRPEPRPPPDPRRLDDAARLLAGASRPVLVAGLGCRAPASAAWLRAFAEALPAPVLTTPRAKGAVPDPHPLRLGVLPGGAAEARILARADLIVALGLDAVELNLDVWPSTAPLLHLAPFPAAAELHRPVTEVVGELSLIVEELAPRLRDRARADWDVAELDRVKRELVAAPAAAGGGLPRHRVVRLARDAMEAGTLAAVDPGTHAGDVAAFWDAVAPGEFLVSDGSVATGFALPAAIAAHLVHPQRRVVCFTAGAGLVAAAAELETAIRLRVPVTIVAFGESASEAPELQRLAQSFGVPAFAADSEARFAEALGRALRVTGPALISVWP